MYTKKFMADSLSEAFEDIKKELGPDAVILKTVTNRGIKGALKKKKIEITAAITEKEYSKKSRVDSVLNDEQKKMFHKSPASVMNQAIDSYNTVGNKISDQGYENLGLNKTVIQNDYRNDNQKSTLDNFLNDEKSNTFSSEVKEKKQVIKEHYQKKEDDKKIIEVEKIDEKKLTRLEKKIEMIGKVVETMDPDKSTGLYQLRTNLKCLGINQKMIEEVINKSIFELKEDDLENYEALYELTLREISKKINIELPLFSKSENQNIPVVTILYSEVSVGQTSTLFKLSSLKNDSVSIIYQEDKNNFTNKKHLDLTKRMLNLEVLEVYDWPNLISACRKVLGNNKSVFIDISKSYLDNSVNINLIKQLKNSFEAVEVLGVISGLHSENYNNKFLNKCKKIIDGLVVTNLDNCTDYSSLLNLHLNYPQKGLKFFTIGPTIPDDIEPASKERLISGIFEL